MTIPFSDLKKGSRLIIDNQPHEIIEATHMVKGRGRSVVQAKIKNLKDGNFVSRTFRPSEAFQEAEISKIKATFLYLNNKGDYFFCEEGNPKNRFSLNESQIKDITMFLKEKQSVEGLIFQSDIINISLPVKIVLKVVEAPPGIKGDRAQSGTKPVTLETGAEIQVPLFVKEGDLIEINSEKKEYVRRV